MYCVSVGCSHESRQERRGGGRRREEFDSDSENSEHGFEAGRRSNLALSVGSCRVNISWSMRFVLHSPHPSGTEWPLIVLQTKMSTIENSLTQTNPWTKKLTKSIAAPTAFRVIEIACSVFSCM